MRIALLPLLLLVLVIIIVVIFISVALNVRRDEVRGRGRGRQRGPGRGPHAAIARVKEPSVRIGRLILAILFFPIVVFFWALASLGDLVEAAVHVLVGSMAVVFATLFSLAGANASAQWRTAGLELGKFARSVYSAGRRFVEYVGFGGFLDRVEDGIRDARRPGVILAPTPPLANPVAAHTFAFEDRYRIESNLAGGGSTARLFVVRRLERDRPVGDRLVLKYFDMGLGSRLGEVLRESRGMQVAREMGIVLDHDLGSEHFYYVMPYYEGETLTRAAARIHRRLLTGQGMEKRDLMTCLGWMSETLRILDAYHRRGVIHKDVKPDNLIVTEEGIRLVDLGLMTPIESALTLTTHGTEFFRDPEMVKLAIAGKRVRDVDAARFDVYSSGAVMYLLLEGSFPACGPLSRFSRPVPMALTAITSRAMAEGTKRYASVSIMRADLEAYRQMLATREPDAIPMTALPSLSGEAAADLAEDVEDVWETAASAPPPPPPPLAPPPLPVIAAAPPPVVEPKPTRRRGNAVTYVAVMLGLVLALFGFLYLLVAREAGAEKNFNRQGAANRQRHVNLISSARNVAVATNQKILRHLQEARRRGETVPTPAGVPVVLVAEPGLERLEEETRRQLSTLDLHEHPSVRLKRALKSRLLAGRTSGSEIMSQVRVHIDDESRLCVVWIQRNGSYLSTTFYGLDGDRSTRTLTGPGVGR